MKRFATLDSFRGLAAVLVVFYHFLNRSPYPFVAKSYLWVDFFFCLSGFVISYNYENKIRDVSEWQVFIKNRLRRLYPLHVFTLLLFVLVEFYKLHTDAGYVMMSREPAMARNTIYSFMSNLTLLQSFNIHRFLSFNYPSWSVGAEFFAYLSFSALCFGLKDAPPWLRKMLYLTLWIASYGFLLRHSNRLEQTYSFGFIRCLGGFFLGVCLRELYQLLQARGVRIESSLPLVASMVVIPLALSQKAVPVDFFMPPLFAGLILSIALTPSTLPLHLFFNGKIWRWMGQRSYSIYLNSAFILWLNTEVLRSCCSAISNGPAGWGNFVDTLLVFAALFGMSEFTYRYIELNFLSRNPGQNFTS